MLVKHNGCDLHCCIFLAGLLKTLSNIGKSYSKGLDGTERILEIQCVGITINSAKLHHLQYAKESYNYTLF